MEEKQRYRFFETAIQDTEYQNTDVPQSLMDKTLCCIRLNEQDARIKELEEENQQLKQQLAEKEKGRELDNSFWKQECDSLQKTLVEKDKEIDNLYDRLNSKQKFYEMSLEKDYKEYLSRLDKLEKQCDKDKISFTIGELEKVKSAFGLINSKLDKVETIKEHIHYIDHQINELKELK